MWVFRPRRAAASASMRPSWPPPRMPMVLPSGSGTALLGNIDGTLRDGLRLLAAMRVEPLGDIGIAEGEDGGGEQVSIGGTGLADGEGADRIAGRHLDDRQLAVLAAQGPRLHRHAVD